jgi:hypothetical protein
MKQRALLSVQTKLAQQQVGLSDGRTVSCSVEVVAQSDWLSAVLSVLVNVQVRSGVGRNIFD